MSSEAITKNDLTKILNKILMLDGVDMTESEVTEFIDSLNLTAANAVDYIVEEGVDNGWEYRLWKNGTYDAWKTYNATGMTLTTSGGGTYYNSTSGNGLKNITLPTFNSGTAYHCTATAIPSISNGVFIYSVGNLSATQVQIGYRAHSSVSSAVCNTSLTLHGNWEERLE